MSKNEISLKPISALLTEKFYIPGYQRGYRWTERQVEDLLNDIREFQRESETKPKETFYCLQPLVVRETDQEGEWELIDGQQRLTTIYLILHYLKDILTILGKTPYRLRYETREDSGDFLQAIDLSRKDENIDYFHISSAYQAIQKWFETQDGTYKIKFLQTLLNDDETGKNVKVIWYKIREKIDPVEVFTRLNIGKIPLTNAELVKALFLRSRNFTQGEITLQQLKIAQEWDSIEKALQAEDFWYFLSNTNQYANRIEYILELMADEFDSAEDAAAVRDPYYTFISFSRRLASADVDSQAEWIGIKRYFMVLEEWYRDRDFYHLIGYLINQRVTIPDIRQLSSITSTKTDFRNALTSLIFSKMFMNKNIALYANQEKMTLFVREEVDELSYGSDKVKPALLLFNIATLLRSRASNVRFQFDSYKKENWDIEHVRSVKSGMPNRADLQKNWLATMVNYFTGCTKKIEQQDFIDNMDDGAPSDMELQMHLKQAIHLADDRVFNTEAFYSLYEWFVSLFDEQVERETDNGIGNLALLDRSTNRSYQNAVFPIKRQRILALDKSATFVPVCTKNVFLKYYSDKVDQMMFWEEEDRDRYQASIVECLVWFFAPAEGEYL